MDAINWDITWIRSVRWYLTHQTICMMHYCEKRPGSDALMKFMDEELQEFEPNAEFIIRNGNQLTATLCILHMLLVLPNRF